MKRMKLTDELTESFINGNKMFVIAEVNKLPKELAMLVCAEIYSNLYSKDLKDEAGIFLFLLWANTPDS